MIRLLSLIFLILFMTLYAGSASRAGSELPDLESQFHQSEIWTGSDGAYSVSLGNGKAIWLFSDTFIGRISGGRRRNNAMINNSIGVQDISSAKMLFYWKGQKKPGSFFPGGKGYWLWLGDGVYHNGKVYCFAKRIAAIPGHEGEPFGFTWIQDELIVIDNPHDNPLSWHCHHHLLPFATKKIHFGTACASDGEQLYVMGLDEPGKLALLARIPLKDLRDLNLNAFEFLTTDSQGNSSWSKSARACTPLFNQAAAEASLTRVGKKYVCIFHSGGAGARIVARTASSVSGPWSAEKLLYTIPDQLCKRGMCYAAKGHPEQLCHQGTMPVTFLINPGKLEAHDKDPYAYFPRVVEVKIPD